MMRPGAEIQVVPIGVGVSVRKEVQRVPSPRALESWRSWSTGTATATHKQRAKQGSCRLEPQNGSADTRAGCPKAACHSSW